MLEQILDFDLRAGVLLMMINKNVVALLHTRLLGKALLRSSVWLPSSMRIVITSRSAFDAQCMCSSVQTDDRATVDKLTHRDMIRIKHFFPDITSGLAL